MTKFVLTLLASVAISGVALAQQTPAEPPARGQPDQTQPAPQPGPQMRQQDRSTTGREIPPGALAPQDVRQVQQALSAKGMPVQVDGRWGPQTQSALRDFQQKQGIQATGQLDQQTIAALGVTLSGPAGQQPPAASPGAPPSGRQPDQQMPNVPQPRQRNY